MPRWTVWRCLGACQGASPDGFACQAALIGMSKAIGTRWTFPGPEGAGPDGTLHSVKAPLRDGNDQLMDVKAFVNGQRLDVKVLESNDELLPVKAMSARMARCMTSRR